VIKVKELIVGTTRPVKNMLHIIKHRVTVTRLLISLIATIMEPIWALSHSTSIAGGISPRRARMTSSPGEMLKCNIATLRSGSLSANVMDLLIIWVFYNIGPELKESLPTTDRQNWLSAGFRPSH
jgi:hypothetical protein